MLLSDRVPLLPVSCISSLGLLRGSVSKVRNRTVRFDQLLTRRRHTAGRDLGRAIAINPCRPLAPQRAGQREHNGADENPDKPQELEATQGAHKHPRKTELS